MRNLSVIGDEIFSPPSVKAALPLFVFIVIQLLVSESA